MFVLEQDVDDLVSATRETGTRLLYDINLQLRFGRQWNPNNAVALLDYIQQKGYGDNLDFELGNGWYLQLESQFSLVGYATSLIVIGQE